MKALRIFTVLLLLLFTLNYFSRKILPFAYADVADYNLLYTTQHSFYIKKLEVVNDSLDILFNMPFDTGTSTFTGNRLRYKPVPGKSRTLTLRSNGRPHSMNIGYAPGNLPYEVTSADIPIEPAIVRDIADWVYEGWPHDKRVDFNEVTRFVMDSAGINNTDSTVQKILKIGRLVLAGMPEDSGSPSESVLAMHPFQQYQAAKAGKANLWCGNYAAIFSAFADAAGIPARVVFTGSSKDKLGLGNHAFCEAYIKEEDCWAYVDLTANTVLLKLHDRYLNVMDVQRLLQYKGGIDSVKSYTVAGDSMQIVPFDSMSGGAKYYFGRNTLFTFFYKDYFSKYGKANVLQRIKNMFVTRPAYAVYSDNLPGRSYHFLFRMISNYLFMLAVVVWLGLLIRYLYLRKYK